MITSKQLVDYAQLLLDKKAVYWYGTFGVQCTTSLYNSKKAQYPSHYKSDRTAGYKADIAAKKICTDCIGLIKGAAWSEGNAHTPKYATNGCPDQSANGMFSWCKSKGAKQGKMSALPEVPGLFLHMDGHAGVYIGDGYAIEAKGFAADVVKTKVAGRGWTGWSYLPFVDYKTAAAPSTPHSFGDRDLKRGMADNPPAITDVSELQRTLIGLGFSCGKWGADGDFGEMTEAAVEAFQFANGLPETGVVDADDFEMIAKLMNPDPEDEGDTGGDTGEDEPAKYVLCTGNTVNVRNAPNTSGAILGLAYKGDVFSYAGETAENGWFQIVYKTETGWISNLYAEFTDADAPAVVAPPEPDFAKVVVVDLDQHSNLQDSKNDWGKVAGAADLLILRCGVTRTETKPLGIGKDDDFAYVAKQCIKHNIPFGVYYYGKVKTATEARAEARKAYSVASAYNPLFYCYDVEEGRLTNACLQAFAAELRVNGVKTVGMYVGHDYYTKYKDSVKHFDFIWIPRYGKNNGKYDPKYAPAYPCDIHQYTSVGKVPGITDSTLDLNRLTGTKPLSWFLAANK